jgi:rhodanese-related sulfurtransferase
MKLLFVLILFSINLFPQDKDTSMSVNELKNAIQSDSTLLILDVRLPEELIGPLGKIDNVVNIPVQQLENRIGELEKYKDRNIAVICRSGHRSAYAQRILIDHGFKAKNVEGGMVEYRKNEK